MKITLLFNHDGVVTFDSGHKVLYIAWHIK